MKLLLSRPTALLLLSASTSVAGFGVGGASSPVSSSGEDPAPRRHLGTPIEEELKLSPVQGRELYDTPYVDHVDVDKSKNECSDPSCIASVSTWCPNDKHGFMSIGVGQISPNDPSGQTLMRYVVSNTLANIVDIGTWNGLGSTLCFLLALQGNRHTKLITLEINREKQEIAKTNLRNYVNGIDVNFVWGSVISSSEIVDIETVFPELAANAEYRRWHSIDVANIDASPNAISAIPERIDFVLFDGGEFTSYYDFVKLFPRCDKFIALDDINAPKCQLIRKVLLEHPDWTEIEQMQHRHGFALFQKKTA